MVRRQGATRLSSLEKESMYELLTECEIRRFTAEESIAFIKEKTGKEMSISWINHQKVESRKRNAKWLLEMKRNRDLYISKFITTMRGSETREKELYRILYSSKDNKFLQLKCISELREEAQFLTTLYDLIPALDQFATGLYENKEIEK